MPGHAALQTDRVAMTNLRNYIEELTGKVEQGRKAGLTVAEMQKRITVASLKSLHSNGYEAYLARMGEQSHSRFRPGVSAAERGECEYCRHRYQPRQNLGKAR